MNNFDLLPALQLGTVSLALFRTLIGLFCEDVMLQLVFRSVWWVVKSISKRVKKRVNLVKKMNNFSLLQWVFSPHRPHGGSNELIRFFSCLLRYLIPCTHLSRKQRRSLNKRDCYSSSAASFLLLMPSWCPVYPHNTNTHSEHIHWPKGAG